MRHVVTVEHAVRRRGTITIDADSPDAAKNLVRQQIVEGKFDSSAVVWSPSIGTFEPVQSREWGGFPVQ
jgi:hypothetical protein